MAESASEERRSPRVLLRVALKVAAPGGQAREAETAVVNRHGGLLLARQPYAEQDDLEITNLESGRKAPFRVVWSGGPGPRSLFKVGVELVEAIEDFWGPDYDRLAENATAPSS